VRRAYRKDENHKDVGDFLRAHGWSVLDLAQYGMSIDYAVSLERFVCLVEVKDGNKPECRHRLTTKEQEVRDGWQGPYAVVLSGPDAIAKLNAIRVQDGFCKLEDIR
jgi:hypothetical protein